MSDKRNPVARYFSNIYDAIVTTIKGMALTGRYLTHPSTRVTMMYPEERPVVPAGSRGLHQFKEEQCMSCMQCVKICPVSCITLEYVGRGKESMITRYDIDYQKCLFCNLCCEVCPTEAIVMTEQWDLCSQSRDGCIVRFARPKTEEEIKAYEAELAAKEAEKKKKAAEAAAAKKAEEDKKAADEAAQVS